MSKVSFDNWAVTLINYIIIVIIIIIIIIIIIFIIVIFVIIIIINIISFSIRKLAMQGYKLVTNLLCFS